MEAELHEVLDTIENTLDRKEYVVEYFLDIENTFSHVKIYSIRRIYRKTES